MLYAMLGYATLGFDVAFLAFNKFLCCAAVLPLMVAFLDQRREEGQAALQILLLLCSSRIDLLKQHADLLVMLQGARRLSNIFCTGQASKVPWLPSIMEAATSACQSHAVTGQ